MIQLARGCEVRLGRHAGYEVPIGRAQILQPKQLADK